MRYWEGLLSHRTAFTVGVELITETAPPPSESLSAHVQPPGTSPRHPRCPDTCGSLDRPGCQSRRDAGRRGKGQARGGGDADAGMPPASSRGCRSMRDCQNRDAPSLLPARRHTRASQWRDRRTPLTSQAGNGATAQADNQARRYLLNTPSVKGLTSPALSAVTAA